jgi:hypothetical protein
VSCLQPSATYYVTSSCLPIHPTFWQTSTLCLARETCSGFLTPERILDRASIETQKVRQSTLLGYGQDSSVQRDSLNKKHKVIRFGRQMSAWTLTTDITISIYDTFHTLSSYRRLPRLNRHDHQ